MRLIVDEQESLRLCDVDDFRSFAVHAASACGSPDSGRLRRALAGAAVLDETGHAWVDEAWLQRSAARAHDEAWVQGFAAMCAYAERAGWRRGEPPAIRAHVVWAPPKTTI